MKDHIFHTHVYIVFSYRQLIKNRMLTPRFTLGQDETFVTINIYAPFTNISDTEIFMDDLDFRFYSKPYFLRLHLPNAIEETDLASAKYDADTNSFVIKAPKKNAGQFFPGLDMISELLKPKGSVNAQPKIEMIEENNLAESQEDEEDIDCYFEQQILELNPVENVEIVDPASETSYGFGFGRANVFSRLLDECQEILDIKDLDHKPFSERKSERKQLETRAFSSEHYLADLFDTNDDLNSILNLASKWKDSVDFSNEDTERMIALGTQRKVPIKVAKENLSSVSFGLLDILFAYCYDFRTTEYEQNSESAWTISKLCATLSCGEKYLNIKECVVTCIRRSICYPLYRHWELALLVWKDVCDVLKYSDKKGLIKILLNIIPLFVNSEGYYLYNQLYIEEYAIWCQSLPDKWVTNCLDSLQIVLQSVSKNELELSIDELESFAKDLVSKQQTPETVKEDQTDLMQRIAALQINDSKVDSDDSDSENSVSQSESSDSSDSSDSEEADSSDTDNSCNNAAGLDEAHTTV